MSVVATGNRLRALEVLGSAAGRWNPTGEVVGTNRYSEHGFPTAMGFAIEREGWATCRIARGGYRFRLTEEGRRVLEASRVAAAAREPMRPGGDPVERRGRA